MRTRGIRRVPAQRCGRSDSSDSEPVGRSVWWGTLRHQGWVRNGVTSERARNSIAQVERDELGSGGTGLQP